jgi:hypothetical protein
VTTGEKAARISVHLLELVSAQNPMMSAVTRFARRAGVTGQLAGSFPPIDDEAAWRDLCEQFAGILLALPADPIDPAAALERGQAIVAQLLEQEPG